MKPNDPLRFDVAQQRFAEAHRVARKMSGQGTTTKRVHKWAESVLAALRAPRG